MPIKSILEDFDEMSEITVDAIVKELKTDAKTYGDLKRAYIRLKCTLLFMQSGKEKYSDLLEQVNIKILTEIDNLPIQKS